MKLTLAILLSIASVASAQNDSGEVPPSAPVASWNFDQKPHGSLINDAKITENAPRKPTYPLFEENNRALTLKNAGAALKVQESDLPEKNLRFTNGDSITLETWVKTDQIPSDHYVYLIGKGRNKSPEFTKENQNWALRLKGDNGLAKPSFLFRSRNPETGAEEYHRWVANKGFTPKAWHHVALTYTFGEPESIRAYVDGKLAKKGKWDMAGPTKLPPVTDGDAIMIGTGNGGSKSNTLSGGLDNIAIYREQLSSSVLTARYVAIPPPPALDPKILPENSVLVQICEDGLGGKAAWPATDPIATESYTIPAFGLTEVPHKYISTGVRGDRPFVYFLRTAAKVTFPKGKHRLLLRGRSAVRLSIDGEQKLITKFITNDKGGHGRIADQEGWLDLGGEDFRFVQPGDFEAWTEFETNGEEHLVVVEKVVGGNNQRPELGELILAISYEGSSDWQLVSPGSSTIPYSNAGWEAYHATQKEWLKNENAKRRAAARAKHADYWTFRRNAAEEFLNTTEDIPVPEPIEGMPAFNAIDHFLNAKIKQVEQQYAQAKPEGVNFHEEILPIFESKCYSCHQGGKIKGGLKLSSLEHALEGGREDGPGIVPGDAFDSAIYLRVTDEDEDYVMPPKGDKLTEKEIATLETWINEGAHWPEMNVRSTNITPLTEDLVFLRRIFLDTVGVPPTPAEIQAFKNDASPDKRSKIIDKLLADERWADKWMGYWQDVLAENPNILNSTLNNTGPFRWWIHESLVDNKPMDLFVTELVGMEGSERFGGPRGFQEAAGNDAPMAAKGTIVSSAFMGVEMKCARCHDAPAHTYLQQDLFEIAALLNTSPVDVPLTSSVPMDKLHQGGREALIEVTLQPGTKVSPAWPFEELVTEEIGRKLAENPDDTRDYLAALITAPQNQRFAQVMANRIWEQIMSRGIVETVEDWQKSEPTHPELIAWLGREFTRMGYDAKKLARLIFNSHAYQRASDPTLLETNPLFTAPAPRRLSAEQIVDSLFYATGKDFDTEELSLDIDGKRHLMKSISLGQPTRSWMLASTSNERDRPSLSLPRIQAVADVLEAFGWRGARQDAISRRETDPSALQPAIIANGTVGVWLTRLSDDHPITELTLQDQPLEDLLDKLYMRLLTRKPTAEEKQTYLPFLEKGYNTRIVENPAPPAPKPRGPAKYVSWTNHLDREADIIRAEETRRARAGNPPTNHLTPEWRNRFEDVLWAILNSPEWVYLK